MLQLAKEELKSYEDAKVCYICGKRTWKKVSQSLNYWKVRGHCHFSIVFVIQNLMCSAKSL